MVIRSKPQSGLPVLVMLGTILLLAMILLWGLQDSGTIIPPRVVTAYEQRVNLGGPVYTDGTGNVWAADKVFTTGSWGYISGSTYAVTNEIMGTVDDTLYQSERYWMGTTTPAYRFTVPNGFYDVTLKFAEIWFTSNGQRSFDVKMEGITVLSNFDVHQVAGGSFKAIDRTFGVTVLDGVLDIDMVVIVAQPKVNAISVRQIVTESTATPTVVRTPTTTPTPGGCVCPPTPVCQQTVTKKGVGRGWSFGTPGQVASLNASWAYSWALEPEAFNSTYQHVPLVNASTWYSPEQTIVMREIALAHPGSYWLVFNEPDSYLYKVATTTAAIVYHDLRAFVKSFDPSARFIVGGIYAVWDTGWVTGFRSEFQRLYGYWPVVEGWHVHDYAEASDYSSFIWRRNLTAFWDWILLQGEPVELWVSEMGCLGSTSVAAQVMTDQTAWLNIQSWITRYAFFATQSSGPGCAGCTGALLNVDGTLTMLGELYRSLP